MLDEIRAALDEAVRVYRDTRVNYCRLDAVSFDGACCALAGAALDDATLAGVLAGLRSRFPAVEFDARQVRVLRPGSRMAFVATNLTSLHAGPSWLAEQVSQLLNGWPLEILMEEGRWCFVRQADGYLGWAYGPYLATPPPEVPVPTHIVVAPVSVLRDAPLPEAPATQRILGGTAVAARVRGDWAYVTLAGAPTASLRPTLLGWTAAAELRALASLPTDEAGRRQQMVADAALFTGVPYLWGGCTAFGMDCSGFAQLLHRLVGVTIPRDADQQFEAGQPAETLYQPGDLLFFGDNAAGARKITHVGMSLGGWRIIHSSRSRNGVYEDDVQEIEHLRESCVGARCFA